MTWANIAKPTTSGWTRINPSGRTQYDQPNTTYDSSTIFWDGIDPNFWTKVAKPNNAFLIVPGMATGMLTPPTYSRQYDASLWKKVAKPTS